LKHSIYFARTLSCTAGFSLGRPRLGLSLGLSSPLALTRDLLTAWPWLGGFGLDSGWPW